MFLQDFIQKLLSYFVINTDNNCDTTYEDEDYLNDDIAEHLNSYTSDDTPYNHSNIIPGTYSYDLTNLSSYDTEYIDSCIEECKQYPLELQAIKLAEIAYSVVYAPRYILHRYIILKYKNSTLPFDILATAIAYGTEGALDRINAINYYEKYFITLKQLPPDSYVFKTKILFPLDLIYDDYCNLCEKEYMYDRAYLYRQKRIKLHGYMDISDLLGIGHILQKTDINRCVKFYQKCLEDYKNSEDLPRIKELYDDALKKQGRNYKYRPRPYKPTDWEFIARKMSIDGAMIFINKHNDK